MKIDLYSKVILTIIAAALWISLIKDIIPQDVYAGRDDIQKVDIVAVSGRTLFDNTVPVTIK